jgi:uncharacterized protein YjbJ (UPF0337 family)
MADLRMEGKWDQIKGRVKETWGEVTDDDLKQAEGNWDQLVGRIKERTGESREAIEAKLRDLRE